MKRSFTAALATVLIASAALPAIASSQAPIPMPRHWASPVNVDFVIYANQHQASQLEFKVMPDGGIFVLMRADADHPAGTVLPPYINSNGSRDFVFFIHVGDKTDKMLEAAKQ